MRVLIIVLITALIAVQPSYAEQPDFPTFAIDSLTGQPGVEITHRQDGSASVTVWTKNDVSVTRTIDGSKTTVFGNDNTGKGAVICSWMIDVEIRAILETCPKDQFIELRQDLDQSIASIDDFIIANGFQPISKAELKDREEKQYTHARATAQADPAGKQKVCMQGDAGNIVSYMNNMSTAQRRQSVADLLSVPRWPVLNPCL